MRKEKVLIMDFGGQYTHLIARRVRELGVYSEVIPWNEDLENILKHAPSAMVLSGGPSSVLKSSSPRPKKEVLKWILEGEIPILGICYGHQLLASFGGGEVVRGDKGEYGPSLLEVKIFDPLFSETPKRQRVWMSHKDYVRKAPPGSLVLASTEYSSVAALKYSKGKVYSIQFHPEVRHTEYGKEIMSNFLYKIARLKGEWKVSGIAKYVIRKVKNVYKGGNVLVAVSGGVDSLTAAFIVSKIAGKDKVHIVFIDTGLLRENEGLQVLKILKRLNLGIIHFIDASKEFLERLQGVSDPEEKRKIIALTFSKTLVKVKCLLERKYGPFSYLVQGTIYPDRIESGRVGSGSAKIKSHHNVVMPDVGLKVLEPLTDLYKDEVRKLALELGLSKEIVFRHPFPGPGLAVRIVGEVTKERLNIIRKATNIVEEELKKNNIYASLWQAFPVLLPLKSVGVMGDSRTYGYIIALRFVKSEDAMTAEFAKLPWDLLEKIANRLVNEVEGVNRVLYDLTDKPPATIEFE